MLRNSDFFSDREYESLPSTRIDHDLFKIGVVSLMLTTLLSLGFVCV